MKRENAILNTPYSLEERSFYFPSLFMEVIFAELKHIKLLFYDLEEILKIGGYIFLQEADSQMLRIILII